MGFYFVSNLQKGAKFPEHYLPKKKLLNLVIWHLWRLEPKKKKTLWNQATFIKNIKLISHQIADWKLLWAINSIKLDEKFENPKLCKRRDEIRPISFNNLRFSFKHKNSFRIQGGCHFSNLYHSNTLRTGTKYLKKSDSVSMSIFWLNRGFVNFVSKTFQWILIYKLLV